MSASPECKAVLVDLSAMSRRDEVYAYAVQRGIGWADAVAELVNHGLMLVDHGLGNN